MKIGQKLISDRLRLVIFPSRLPPMPLYIYNASLKNYVALYTFYAKAIELVLAVLAVLEN